MNILFGRLQHSSVISMSGWNLSSAVWHSATILANIFHTGILVNIPELLQKPSGKVLLAMALTDIYFSSAKLVDGIVRLTTNQYNTGSLYVDALWSAWKTSSYNTRFYVTASGCFDRYMALCHPFKYNLNRVIRNIGKFIIGLSLLLHLLSWGLYIAKEEVDSNVQRAFEPNSDGNTSFLINATQHAQSGGGGGTGNSSGNGDSSSSSQPNRTKNGMTSGSAFSRGAKNDPIKLTIRSLIHDLPSIPAFCVMLVCMPLTIKELTAMKKRSAVNPGGCDRELAITTIYILLISLISLLCLIPLYVIRHMPKDALPRLVTQAIKSLNDGYGMLNIIMYGIMNKKYRETLKVVCTKIRFSCAHNSQVGQTNERQRTTR